MLDQTGSGILHQPIVWKLGKRRSQANLVWQFNLEAEINIWCSFVYSAILINEYLSFVVFVKWYFSEKIVHPK